MAKKPERSAETSAGVGLNRRKGVWVAVSPPVMGFDKVYFTDHVLSRMRERHISQQDVIHVLRSAAQKGLRADPGRKRWRGTPPHRREIDVVFIEWLDAPCVITAYPRSS